MLSAQNRNCGTMPLYEQNLIEYPEIQKFRDRIDEQAASYSSSKADVIFIPVVVHVVYRTAAEDISFSQIQSQIDVLNEDFGRTNSDASQTPAEFQSLATDTDIRFCLAQRDPSGLPTNGVTRTQTTAMSFGLGGAVKTESSGGKSPWPSDQYLNIWVCNLSSNLIGFATLPGAAAPGQDGVVIAYKHFGRTGNVEAPYNRGRTATHEIGHWLNLLHIWGDDENTSNNCAGTDQVADTPNQGGPYFGCPNAGTSSCGSNDMYMNYMDYTDDQCMNLFTRDQKARMLATLNGFRSSIKNSEGCSAPPVANDCDTLNNIFGGDGLVYYLANEYFPDETGYLTGTNSLGDLAFAEKFNTTEEKAIYGAIIDFAYALESAPGAFVKVVLWDSDGVDGSPGSILNQITYPISTVVADIDNFMSSNIEFTLPAMVLGDYYLGFETNAFTGDSIAIYTNQFDEINVNTAWQRQSSGNWLPCNDDLALGNAVTLAVKSIQCSTVGIEEGSNKAQVKIYPNPSLDGNFTIEFPSQFGKTNWQCFGIDGKLNSEGQLSAEKYQTVTGPENPGIYYLRLIPQNGLPQVFPVMISGN